jgi:hypothetical protein
MHEDAESGIKRKASTRFMEKISKLPAPEKLREAKL